MWENVGIIRERKGLEIAVRELARMRKEADERWWSEGINAHTIEYRNATMLATLIAKGALERTESRGLQYRLDYPLMDDEHWKHDTIRKGPKP
jgi:L-aspartate oxidase